MDDIEIDGAQLWFPSEIRLVETIRFIDRRYLGVITTRSGTEIFYASLMRKSSPEEKDTPVMWTPYTLCEAMTDSVSHGREIVLNAYEALSDRLATNS